MQNQRLLHPATDLFYFLLILILICTAQKSTSLLLVILTGGMYFFAFDKGRALLQMLLGVLPLGVLLIVFQALFNHRGEHILFYFNDNPVTLESIYAGIQTVLLIFALLIWFQVLSFYLSRYDFLYLSGRIFPTLSMMLVMILSYFPRMKQKLTSIEKAAYTLGCSTRNGTNMQKLKAGSHIFSALFMTSLEDSIETADSMTARGYGLRGKTHYRSYSLHFSDFAAWCCLIVLCAICFFAGSIWTVRICFLLLLLFRLGFTLKENFDSWHYWK